MDILKVMTRDLAANKKTYPGYLSTIDCRNFATDNVFCNVAVTSFSPTISLLLAKKRIFTCKY